MKAKQRRAPAEAIAERALEIGGEVRARRKQRPRRDGAILELERRLRRARTLPS